MARNRLMICDYCGLECGSRKKLVVHIDKHRNLKCEVCGKTYETGMSMRNHLKSHFDENKFIVCDICGKSVYKWRLKRHKEHHELMEKKQQNALIKKEYLCRFCGLSFENSANRCTHEKQIHKDNSHFSADYFKCKECTSAFRTRNELREHSFEHFSGKLHFCDFPDCDKYFKKAGLLNIHKKSHFEPQVKCLDCGAFFVHRSGLFKHQKTRCPAKKPPPIAPTDEELERNAEKAKEQFIKLNGKIKALSRPKTEPIAKEEDDNEHPIEFVIHEIKVEPDIDEWEYLDEAFAEESPIKVEIDEDIKPEIANDSTVHYAKQPKSTMFICDLCGCNYADKDSLKRHITAHKSQISRRRNAPPRVKRKRIRKPQGPFECDLCGKKLLMKTTMLSHLLVTHSPIGEFSCDECGSTFKRICSLRRHKSCLHSGVKQFGCEKCGAMFIDKWQLQIHSRNHDEPTECTLCGRMVANIIVHMRNHASKNDKVKCPVCDKEIRRYRLMRHIRAVHEKPNVHTCKDCGENFNRINDLRQHQYINHSQSKIYECSECGSCFKERKLLSIHRFSHQPLNIACEICNNVYARKGALRKHQKKHHPELFYTKQEVDN